MPRTVKTGTCTSRLAIDYRAKFLDDERIELEVDSSGDAGVLQLRVYDPKDTVVCERMVRTMPVKVVFKALAEGRYQMELSNIDKGAKRTFTWSDWDNDFDADPNKLPDGVMAYAFLDVK
jgi:hypothetical protein